MFSLILLVVMLERRGSNRLAIPVVAQEDTFTRIAIGFRTRGSIDRFGLKFLTGTQHLQRYQRNFALCGALGYRWKANRELLSKGECERCAASSGRWVGSAVRVRPVRQSVAG